MGFRESLVARKRQWRILLSCLQKMHGLNGHFGLWILTVSRTVREYISDVLSHQVCGNLLSIRSFFFFLTLQYCISFAKYRNESATGIPAFFRKPIQYSSSISDANNMLVKNEPPSWNLLNLIIVSEIE